MVRHMLNTLRAFFSWLQLLLFKSTSIPYWHTTLAEVNFRANYKHHFASLYSRYAVVHEITVTYADHKLGPNQ